MKYYTGLVLIVFGTMLVLFGLLSMAEAKDKLQVGDCFVSSSCEGLPARSADCPRSLITAVGKRAYEYQVVGFDKRYFVLLFEDALDIVKVECK